MFKKLRLTFVLFAAFCISFVAFLIFNPSHAYFQNFTSLDGVNSAKIDLLFDKFDANGTYGDYKITLKDDNWGTEENPYLLTKKNHVSNLFVLQRSGYFLRKTNADGSARQSHFMVCDTATGKTIAINCDGMTINPIGSPTNPFTGCIQGAPVAGEATYTVNGKTYTVTQSTIANLKVVTTATDTVINPDVGFFGRLGYAGKEETQSDGTISIVADTVNGKTVGPFAASVNNLLFADITIKNEKTLSGTVAAWWAGITGDAPHANCDESHHVGIVAGHVKFATLSNISVYYSPNVAAFELLGNGTNTNYYSIVGIIGTAEYANPSTDTNGRLNSGDAISDAQLSDDLLSGGGGEGSGSLTGYMLAKTLYDRHQAYLATTQNPTYKNEYDVTEMKNKNGGDLFKTVTMKERDNLGDDWVNRDYYYFADTVFTFAMSVPEGGLDDEPDAADYVIKIWDINEEKESAPPIKFTTYVDYQESGAKGYGVPDTYEYIKDPNLTKYKHTLKPVTEIVESTDQSPRHYVLAYYSNNVLYTLDLDNTASFCQVLSPTSITIDSSDGITISEIQVEDSYEVCSYSFQKKDSAFLNRNNYKLAVRIKQNILFAEGAELHSGKVDNSNSWLSEYNYFTNWTVSKSTAATGQTLPKNAVNLSGTTWSGFFTVLYHYLSFDTATLAFDNISSTTENATEQGKDKNLLLFEVTGSEQLSGEDTKNFFIMSDAPEFEFDPSKEILFYNTPDTGATTQGTPAYTVTPLSTLKWNNGKGQYLTSLNHAARMYEAQWGNFQLKLSNSFLGDWFGENSEDALNTNKGGVVIAPLGTTGIEYTIPAGMIAFYITEVPADSPSYINIIVGINPERGGSRIGLYSVGDLDGITADFDLANPDSSFPLPTSKVASGETDNSVFTRISGYYEKNADGTYKESATTGDYVTYLGGKVALVGCSFKITGPGLYLLGSTKGPMSVCYFSVSGAAGAGSDGMSGSPLGDVDFVYDNGANTVISVDKKFTGEHIVANEDLTTTYYPSYYYVRLLPTTKLAANAKNDGKIPYENVYIRRYGGTKNAKTGISRYIDLNKSGDDDTRLSGLSEIYQDNDADATG